MTISDYLEEAWNKTLRGGGNGTTFTAPANIYVKLHIGDPGEAGTANAAAETTRQAITFAAPNSTTGVMLSSNAPAWTSVAGSETYSHISLWDASTSGNCLFSGALTASQAVTAGNNFTLTSGGVSITLA